jgi:hypothetical protein
MIRRFINLLVMVAIAQPAAGGPLLSGVVEDVNAQTIEMPSLPGSWQRRIEWMAPEGSEVEIGALVVRLDPGDLISQEQQSRANLEKTRLSAARRIDELQLYRLNLPFDSRNWMRLSRPPPFPSWIMSVINSPWKRLARPGSRPRQTCLTSARS